MKKGQKIFLTDGEGNLYTGTIMEPDPKKCLVTIQETTPGFGKRSYSLHVAIAPTKNTDRFEWFLEKATEIGIDEVTPVFCQHSERKVLKTERLNKVLLSAMKQSLKTYLPRLNEPVALDKFLSTAGSPNKLICSLNASDHLKNNLVTGGSYLVLIGPEGDFSDHEISLSQKNNFKPVSLGPGRLRTETAGIVACSIVSLSGQ
jgi:16S rRNA (uracil1498-N3)-methyltransferase